MAIDTLILRHAEKPDSGDEPDLSARGRLRAAALSVCLPQRFGRPDYLFAARDTKESRRSRLTLTPLSQALGVPINCTFDRMDFDDMAKHLQSGQIRKDTIVVIAWHHGTIPELVKHLGVQHAPAQWDDNVFDQFWRVQLGKDDIRFELVHQQLLFGDSQG